MTTCKKQGNNTGRTGGRNGGKQRNRRPGTPAKKNIRGNNTKNTRHGTAARSAIRRPKPKARRNTLRRWWKRAGWRRRILAVAGTALAAVCAVALAWGTTSFVGQRIALVTAEERQQNLGDRYGFDPGNIISDGQFFNGYAMSRTEVQSFLDEHGGDCTGTGCLKNRTFDTTDQPDDRYCDGYDGAKGETAATIIDKSSRSCGISQKVLLTVLQKEQQLVTASKPTDFQFKAAMGLSCPDDNDCDPQYAGFFRQVYGAVHRYRYYVRHEASYGYHVGKLNFVRFHPNTSCGGANVVIGNKATALLYIYTPYQPNEAALAAGAGEGDSCSSYGNRNFSIIYRGWFGDARH